MRGSLLFVFLAAVFGAACGGGHALPSESPSALPEFRIAYFSSHGPFVNFGQGTTDGSGVFERGDVISFDYCFQVVGTKPAYTRTYFVNAWGEAYEPAGLAAGPITTDGISTCTWVKVKAEDGFYEYAKMRPRTGFHPVVLVGPSPALDDAATQTHPIPFQFALYWPQR